MKRPYSKSGRNKHWWNTVNKVGYDVEIVLENLTRTHSCDLERKLISYYGRKDLGNGNLVNMTDGGDGSTGYKMSEESRKKMSEAAIGKIISDETRKRMSKAKSGKGNAMYDKPITEEHRQKLIDSHSILLLNIETGIFYLGYREAAKTLNICTSYLSHKLNGRAKNNTSFIKV